MGKTFEGPFTLLLGSLGMRGGDEAPDLTGQKRKGRAWAAERL